MNATVASLLQTARTEIPDWWESELLLAAILDTDRTALYCHPERVVNAAAADKFTTQLQQRREGWPIAYLLGQREFWSLPFKVNRNTLIPRPETELLVEVAIAHIPEQQAATIIDIGTGCGAVALAIASERAYATVIATDSDSNALDVARINRTQLGLRNVTFAEGNIFTPVANIQADIIVSNPPYLCDSDHHLKQGDLRFEPRHALSAGNDPMAMLKNIISQAPPHLKNNGWLAVEHGWEQGAMAREIYTANGYSNIETRKDLAGHDRLSIGQLQK